MCDEEQCECQVGMSPRLRVRGSDAETARGRGCADLSIMGHISFVVSNLGTIWAAACLLLCLQPPWHYTLNSVHLCVLLLVTN